MQCIVPCYNKCYICSMNLENTKSQMRKGILEFCILSILAHGDAYANELLQKLKASKLIVVEGTLYPLLTRLKNLGLLQYRWEESMAGPPRKYYSLTSKGHDLRAELNQTWEELAGAVAQIQQINTQK